VARLCLNCDEVHDQLTCPLCSSESFAYISRWVPAPERRTQPRQRPSRETADIYRQLLEAKPQRVDSRRWRKRGVLVLGAAVIAGWALRRTTSGSGGTSAAMENAPADSSKT